MTRITDPSPTNINQHKKIELENITKKELLRILEGKQNDPKQQLTIKINTNTLNQVRIYAKEHDTSMTNTIETIVTNYFKNKTITRDTITPKHDIAILLPLENEARQRYIKGHINLILNDPEILDDNNVKPNEFDKFTLLGREIPDNETQGIYIDTINNLLDNYDSEEKCYYSNYHVDHYDNPLLNHLGVQILETHTGEDNALHYDIILIHSYDQEIQEVRLITKKECCDLASEVNNTLILDYFDTYTQHEYIDTVQRDITDKKLLRNEVVRKEQEVNRLQQENMKLLDDKKRLIHIITDMRTKKHIPVRYNGDAIEQEVEEYTQKIKLLENENNTLQEKYNNIEAELRYMQREQEHKDQEVDKIIELVTKKIRNIYEE